MSLFESYQRDNSFFSEEYDMDEDEDVVLIMMMYMPEIESCTKRSTYNETCGKHPLSTITMNLFVPDHGSVPRTE